MTWLAITLGILAMLVILALLGRRQQHEEDRLRQKVAKILGERQNIRLEEGREDLLREAEIVRQRLRRAGLDEFSVSILDVDGGPRLAITTPERLTPERSRRLMAAFDVAFEGEGEVRHSSPVRPQVH